MTISPAPCKSQGMPLLSLLRGGKSLRMYGLSDWLVSVLNCQKLFEAKLGKDAEGSRGLGGLKQVITLKS